MKRHLGFVAAAVGSTGVVAGYLAWTALRFGGAEATVAFEDGALVVAALFCAAACAAGAVRSTGRLRTGWALLAAAALCWTAGELIWAVFEVGLSVAAPFPSIAGGYLAGVPLVVVGIMNFPSSPSTLLNRMRALLDSALVAAAVIFVAWAFGFGDLYNVARVGLLGRVLATAYPAADILIITLLVMTLRRAAGAFRVALVLLMVAFLAHLAADSTFAYLTLAGGDRTLGSMLDAGWVAAYLVVGLAALWPAHEQHAAPDDGAVEIWQLAMPWVAILVVIVSTVIFTVTGRQEGPMVAWIGSVLGLLFILSQVLAFNDSLQLLARSRRAESELRERTELLGEVIGRAPLGIGRIGLDLRIIDANPSLSSMLGVPATALVGASLKQFLSPDEAERAEARTQSFVKGEVDAVELDTEMTRGDGRKLWVHRSISVVRKPDGKAHYFLVMFEDITAKHDVEQSALANLSSLERLNRLKSEFMSMVSHEFRTALTGIQGYSEVMNTGDVTPDEVKEFSGDINAESLRLNRMITEMLDLDRIESGRVTLQIKPMNLNRIIRGAAERAQMSTTKHKISTELDPNLPAVEGDPDRLTQVIANLLSNGIKYSPGGGEVVVRTRVVEGSVVVSVKDHGQGIPPEFKSRIFGRYERYEAGNSQVVGTGLGLAIAQQIVQLHKGRIWVESEPGEGSEFFFTVPAVRRAPSRFGASAPWGPGTAR